MCKLTLTAGLCLVIASLASASHLRLVCSYDSMARDRVDGAKVTVSDIDPNLCTHLIYASADIDQGHRLAPKYTNEETNYQAFNTLKTRNPKLKTLLSVGDLDLQKFSEMMSTQPRRARFIRSAILALRKNEFDGLNLIWRYTGGAGSQQQEKQRFTLLCKELKEAFVGEVKQIGRDRLIFTASVPAEKATIDASYEVAQIAMHLDFINVLTFYFHDHKESVTRHHSPLFKGSHDTGDNIYLNADYAMRYWRDLGAPAQKLNMGLAAFGKTFELSSAYSVVGAPVKGPGEGGSYTSKAGFLAYYEICPFLAGAAIQSIPDQRVPFAVNGNQWVGFENQYSLVNKVCYLKANKFGGAFVWSLDLDDFSGQLCKQGNYPFISQVQSLLKKPCKNPCIGQVNGQYPRPYDPHSFYNCADGLAYLQQCAANSVFRESCSCCVHPTNTLTSTTMTNPTTKTTPTTKSKKPSEKPSVNFCAGRTNGLYPNPADPSTYYNCANGRDYLQQCAEKLVFKESCNCCDRPTTLLHSKAINTPATKTTPTTTTEKPSEKPSVNFCAGRTNGLYPNPADQCTYYNCDNGRDYLQRCAEKLVFKESCNCCDRPTTILHSTAMNTPATKTTPTTTTEKPSEKPSVNFCAGRTDGLYPNPADPSTYYNCANGRDYLQHCPTTLVYKASCKCCNFP